MKLHLNLCLLILSVQLALPADVRYRIVPIYPPAELNAWMIAALAVNDHGVVVGEMGYWLEGYESVGINRYFQYSGGTNAVEPDWMPGYVSSSMGINNSGQIAVYVSRVPRLDNLPAEFDAYRFTPGVGYEPLGSFGGINTEAEDINEAGQVTGYSEEPDGCINAFRYTDGIGLENIGTNFTLVSHGFAINDLGWVAGYGDGYAFIYRDDLGVINLGRGRAYGLNNRGTAVGVIFGQTVERGLIYLDGEVMIVGPEDETTILNDINEQDIAVGIGFRTISGRHLSIGLIWNKAEGLINLNSLIHPDRGWALVTAASINEYGQIAGSGSFENQHLSYRLDPIPPKLSIQHSPTNLTVSWSPAWPGLILEASENLSAPDWQPVDTGGTNVVALPMEPRRRFFRLNLEGIRGLCCAPD
jgi:probable HAF family extracellular repeat protein